MAIKNAASFASLNSSVDKTSPTYRTHSIVWEMRSFKDKKYWYVEYKFVDSFEVFPVESWITEEALAKVRSGEWDLMLVNFHESFPDTVRSIYKKIVKELAVPPQHITLGSGNPDMILEVKKLSQEYGVGEIKVDWFTELEYALWEQKTRGAGLQYKLNTLEHKQYPKAYLNFNRRWRMHRPTIVALLAEKNLLDKGFVSLGQSDDGNNWKETLLSVWHFNQDEIIQSKIKSKFNELLALKDMYLDTNDLVTNRSFLETSTDYYYENSYFSLVTETNYYTDDRLDSRGRFLTEKTFKCIAVEHPFILVTVPNSLSLLHQLGYKTFSPWINEDYDLELNDYRRFEKIIQEVERLSNLSESELSVFLEECKKICKHNYETLMSKKLFACKINY
jgi:hypothetical protein